MPSVADLLTVEEVAATLAVSERMVRRMAGDGRLAPTKVGKFLRFHPDDVEAYIAAQRSLVNPMPQGSRGSRRGGQGGADVASDLREVLHDRWGQSA
jgi:excisionase family DNA binding protein